VCRRDFERRFNEAFKRSLNKEIFVTPFVFAHFRSTQKTKKTLSSNLSVYCWRVQMCHYKSCDITNRNLRKKFLTNIRNFSWCIFIFHIYFCNIRLTKKLKLYSWTTTIWFQKEHSNKSTTQKAIMAIGTLKNLEYK